MPKSTPYLGILSELGIWPVEQHVEYKRIMLLHRIINSKDSRFLKEVIEEQIRDTFKGCWSEQTMEICKKYNLGIHLIKCLTKEKLKSIMKNRIARRLDLHIKAEAKNKTKLRFCSGFNRKKYTTKGNINFNTARSIMKLRLNMLEVKNNYKGTAKNETCGLCAGKTDTTEHLFECEEIKKQIKVPSIELLKKDQDDSYNELKTFLNDVCEIKGINMSKTVKDNLEKNQEPLEIYNVKKIEREGLKITLSRVKTATVGTGDA